MALIEITDLVKVYKVDSVEVRALRGLALEVKEGEMIGLIGPSGSGKTTLLNVIGGLTRATAGTVEVLERDLQLLSSKELADYRLRTIGHIFQTLNLVPILTAAENIELPMVALKTPQSTRNERVKHLLEIVGLSRRGSHRPSQLSGGERQRVAIAAALANDAPLLLADEPTGELDTETAAEITALLQRINREEDKTIIVVTHDPKVARTTNRILRIQDGMITGSYLPAGLDSEVQATKYTEQLKLRVDEVQRQLQDLDSALKQDSVTGSDYAKKRQQLETLLAVLTDEIHRSGTST